MSSGSIHYKINRLPRWALNHESGRDQRPASSDKPALSRREGDHFRRDRSRSRSGGPTHEDNSSHPTRRQRRRRQRLRAHPDDRHRYEQERYDQRETSQRNQRHRRSPSRSSSSALHSGDEHYIQGAPTGVVSDDDDYETSKPNQRPLIPVARSYSTDEEGGEDQSGHYRGCPGVVIAERFRVIKEVGLGTFGRVLDCLDLRWSNGRASNRRGSYVAVKVVRQVRRYYESALIEAKIVEDVNRRGGRGLTHCVTLHEAFTFGGHFCMVFESLGPSLYDFLKKRSYQAFPMVYIVDFTLQILETLEFLHSFRLIHTDLKIENILLASHRETESRIKVIDFGSAVYDYEKKTTIINTRQYRAPEVILGTGWSMPSDMWSAGCILAELYQGELLFATHNDCEHLALMERSIGLFPRWMIDVSKNSRDSALARSVFNCNGRHRMERVLSEEGFSFASKTPRLESTVRRQDHLWLLNLLRMILVLDPTERATAHECLKFLSPVRFENRNGNQSCRR